MAKRRSRKKGGNRKRKDSRVSKPRSESHPPVAKSAHVEESPADDIAVEADVSPKPQDDTQRSNKDDSSSSRPEIRKRRGRVMQPLRRGLLALSLLSIFVLPLAQLTRANIEGSGAVDSAAMGPGIAIASAIPGLSALGGVVSGSPWSLTVAGVEFTDPLAAALVLASSRSAVLVLAALIPVVLTLLLGRVFCGWLCPARLPVELAAWLRRRSKSLKLEAPWLRWLKYGVLAAGLLLAALTGWNLLALIYPPAILVREAHYVLAYGAMGWGAVVVGGAFVADLFVERGAWCRGLCPGGALYSLLGQTAVVRIGLVEQRCTRCRRCQKICPMGLEPTDEPGGECDRCGLCQSECRDDALQYRLEIPFAKGARATRAKNEAPDGK